jgi:helix-turn-helix protein
MTMHWRSVVLNLRSTAMNQETPERFVDVDEAAKFLSLTRRRVLDLARAGQLPSHPIGHGTKRTRLFCLSEIASAITAPKKSGFMSEEKTLMVRPRTVVGRSSD